MKTRNLVLMAAATATAMLAGCADDGELTPNVPDLTDTPIHVKAGVNNLVDTRAGYVKGDEPATILLRIRQANESYSWTHVTLAKTDGEWAPTNLPDGQQLLWCSTTPNATVRAFGYGPEYSIVTEAANNSNSFDNTVYCFQQVDQSTPEGVTSSEFLYCYRENVSPEEDGSLSLDFDHALSKLVISYTYGTELDGSDRQLTACTIGEVINRCMCAFYGAQVTFADWMSSGVTVTACVDEAAQTVECILLPQTVATYPTATFTVSIDGVERVFTCQVKADELVSNTLYTMNVTIGRDKVLVGDVTMNPWGKPLEMGDLETE